MLFVGIALTDEPLGGTDEVVEDVLLVHLRTSLVPLLTILAATAEGDLRIDAALLQERHAVSREGGNQ